MSAINDNDIEALVLVRAKLGEHKEVYNAIARAGTLCAAVQHHECEEYFLLRERFFSTDASDCAREDLESWKRKGIETVVLGDPQYPQALSRIDRPPLILFYRGSSFENILSQPVLAIVGSRKADKIGAETAYNFSRELARRGACVVSGLALGIDTEAHCGALDSNVEQSTVAVLGGGLEKIYPSSNFNLAQRIEAQKGLLISQFEPQERPYPANFLNRNRIIAGLAYGVLVIRAGERSGSLVTARYGLEQGKEIMVVPGAINDPGYRGSNELIKQGAHLVTSPEDIWEILPGLIDREREQCNPPAKTVLPLSETQRRIISILSDHGALHYDALDLGLSKAGLAGEILSLELDGVIVRLPGNYLALGVAKNAI